MLLDELSSDTKVYIVTGRTDMRRSFDGLMAIIRDTCQMDPYADALYLFCGRKSNTLKALYFDQTGFVLCTKRLGKLSTLLDFSRRLSAHNTARSRKAVDNLPEKRCFYAFFGVFQK